LAHRSCDMILPGPITISPLPSLRRRQLKAKIRGLCQRAPDCSSNTLDLHTARRAAKSLNLLSTSAGLECTGSDLQSLARRFWKLVGIHFYLPPQSKAEHIYASSAVTARNTSLLPHISTVSRTRRTYSRFAGPNRVNRSTQQTWNDEAARRSLRPTAPSTRELEAKSPNRALPSTSTLSTLRRPCRCIKRLCSLGDTPSRSSIHRYHTLRHLAKGVSLHSLLCNSSQ
jgi:hypothetical protein